MQFVATMISTEILLRAAVLFAMFGLVLVAYLTRFIEPLQFRLLKWHLSIVTGLFWFLIWLILVILFWESVFHYIFPDWSRWIIPPVFGLIFTSAGLIFWWLSNLSGTPVISYLMLSGLWGIITSLIVMHLGILDKPPVLQEANPFAAVVMSVFEFIFFHCIIIGIARLWQMRGEK